MPEVTKRTHEGTEYVFVSNKFGHWLLRDDRSADAPSARFTAVPVLPSALTSDNPWQAKYADTFKVNCKRYSDQVSFSEWEATKYRTGRRFCSDLWGRLTDSAKTKLLEEFADIYALFPPLTRDERVAYVTRDVVSSTRSGLPRVSRTLHNNTPSDLTLTPAEQAEIELKALQAMQSAITEQIQELTGLSMSGEEA